MNILEKFYSDADKLVQQQPAASFRKALTDFFCKTIRLYDKQLEPLAADITNYWLDSHQADNKAASVEWFYTVFSLFDGHFEPEMNFCDSDWQELTALVSASADYLDMNTVQALMSVFVERHTIQ